MSAQDSWLRSSDGVQLPAQQRGCPVGCSAATVSCSTRCGVGPHLVTACRDVAFVPRWYVLVSNQGRGAPARPPCSQRGASGDAPSSRRAAGAAGSGPHSGFVGAGRRRPRVCRASRRGQGPLRLRRCPTDRAPPGQGHIQRCGCLGSLRPRRLDGSAGDRLERVFRSPRSGRLLRGLGPVPGGAAP